MSCLHVHVFLSMSLCSCLHVHVSMFMSFCQCLHVHVFTSIFPCPCLRVHVSVLMSLCPRLHVSIPPCSRSHVHVSIIPCLHVSGISQTEKETNGKRQLPFVFCKRKSETSNFRLFAANGNVKRKFVFLGSTKDKRYQRLLFQPTYPSMCVRYMEET